MRLRRTLFACFILALIFATILSVAGLLLMPANTGSVIERIRPCPCLQPAQ